MRLAFWLAAVGLALSFFTFLLAFSVYYSALFYLAQINAGINRKEGQKIRRKKGHEKPSKEKAMLELRGFETRSLCVEFDIRES